MSDTMLDVPTDASEATDRDSWLAVIDLIGEEEGYFQTVGPKHWAMFVEDSPTLLVSFETIDQARARPGQMPLAHDIAAAKGWSHLCLIAEDQTWFRDPAVYAYFDRLVDDAFFEDFDRVMFFGSGPSAYAAAAFCVTAPGCEVLLMNPVATVDPASTRWDDRFKSDRRLDFTSRYGYAPDMVEGAAHVTLIYDPTQRLDSMHASLFRAPYISHLHTRFGGPAVESVLGRLGILNEVVMQACEGRLTAASLSRLWRKRRDDAGYLKYLLQAVENTGKRSRVLMLCQNVCSRMKITRFRRRLAELTAPEPPAT